MKHRLLLVLCILLPTLMSAQNKIYVGYCDNTIATSSVGHVTGISGNNADIDMAIRLPQKALQAYVGCKITGIHLGLPAADNYPKEAKAWVRTVRDGANLTAGTISALKEGWSSVTTTQSYTITGNEQELWVGVSFHQDTKLNIISFAGPTNEDGAWICKNGSWNSYASKSWGSLSIEAIVEGGVPTHNLMLYNVETKDQLVKIGTNFQVTGSIKNLATSTAVKPYLRYSLNGHEVGRYTINKDVAYLETADFTISIPTDIIEEDGTVDCEIALCWSDGSEDEAANDNVAHLTLELVRELYYRKMVVEEGTGGWCGWCVYGIVALREMKKLYPDTFIGIAVHSGDRYEIANYTPWLVKQLPSGFPGCVVNRGGKEELPRLPELQGLYARMPSVADAGVKVMARMSGDKLVLESETRFFRNMTNQDYRMVYVITENQLPITQKNYYTGNARGEMGGFENLPGDVDILIDDVARGIYPSVEGQKGGFPADVQKGTTYYYRCTTSLPKYADAKNLEVIALLLDGKTGQIVQADKTDAIWGLNAELPEGIAPISIDKQVDHNTYDLTGRCIIPVRGQLYIEGRKVRLNR